jgi:tetratricopeptide (TPR) repeat protein
MPPAAAALLALLALPLAGCPHAGLRPGERPAREVVLEPTVISGSPDAELGLTDFDAATLFHEGARLHAAGQCAVALPYYQRLLKEFPDSRYLSSTAFNSGRCLEELGRTEEALIQYRAITQRLPSSKDWVDAAFRESQCLAGLGRHREAVQPLELLLNRAEISVSDRIDALVLRGESLDAQGELLLAERSFRAALRIFREREREEYLDPTPAARAEFRLAEQATRRFAAAPLRLPESQMEDDLEAKARLLLESQAGYLRSMRFGDPEWATASGYRIGTLYLELHRALEAAPAPSDLGAEEVEVYRDLLRSRLAVLLRKALKVFEMTLQLAERTRSDNSWTKAAREEMTRVEATVMRQLEAEAHGTPETPPPDPDAPLPPPVPPAPPGPPAMKD